MRIQVPSRSPSPRVRRTTKSLSPQKSPSNRYGLSSASDISSSESETEDVGDVTIVKEEEEEIGIDWDFQPAAGPSSPKPNRPARTTEEQWAQQEFYTAVKLRQRRDPVEEYEEKQRRACWRKAHERTRRTWQPISNLLASAEEATELRLRQARKAQMEEVRSILEGLQFQKAEEEEKSRLELESKNRLLWENIENSIKQSELLARRLEEEKRREAERLRKAEEDRLRREAEESENRAREAALQAKREAEEKRRKEEDDARQKQEEEEKSLESQAAQFKPLDAQGELKSNKEIMRRIKEEIMPSVKKTKVKPQVEPNPEWKKEWSRLRRIIVPKIGQVTNVRGEIIRITQTLHEILAPNPPHPESLYIALLYSLSKALLKQAEEEVAAKPSTAYPLARIVIGLVALGHARLGEVFMAKMVAMTGGWAVGVVIRREEGQTDDKLRKALGQRPAGQETSTQYIDRLCGVLTLYAAILQSPIPVLSNHANPSPTGSPGPTAAQVPPPFQTSRVWTWIARLLANELLMRDLAAPNVLAAILETAGDRMFEVWGKQAVKLRRMLGRKCFETEATGMVIGGVEGRTARLRLGLLLEKWEDKGIIAGEGRWTKEDEDEMRRAGIKF